MRPRRRTRTRSGWTAVALVILAAAPFFIAAGFYTAWRSDRLATLEAGSSLALIPEGVMEFADRGEGPVALVIHGSPGGYDQGMVYGKELMKRGFRVIAVSRPGYLRTPLETGVTIEEQADAIDSLLRSIGISKCAVLGISEGSPCALLFSSRHPERVGSLVLLSPPAASLTYPAIASIGYKLFHDLTGDLGCWLLRLQLRTDPSALFAGMMNIGSSLKPSRCSALAAEALADPEQKSFLSDLTESITPLLPREPGIINDNAQLKNIRFPGKGTLAVPLLVLAGENESRFRIQDLNTLAATTKGNIGSKIEVIPRVGHILPVGREFRRTWDDIAAFMKSR